MTPLIRKLHVDAHVATVISLGAAMVTAAPAPSETVVAVSSTAELARAVSSAGPATTIRLAPGEYRLRPFPYTEPTCGNCEDPLTSVEASVGLLTSGHAIRLAGAGADSTIIRTGAGYGILFQGCRDCAIENVTITGGVRDRDPNATDAAIVVKHSRVRIVHCRIEDNIGDPEVVGPIVVGIAGIAGREGADIHIEQCVIRRSSWDGIALYRGARAAIFDNVIDGVDRARGREIGGGRGVGIGVTWDADAVIAGNLVRNYWKGIGLFVDARALVRENVVEHVLTWGISLWDGDRGSPRGIIERNAVYDTGACGVSIVRTDSTGAGGRLADNAFVRTGQDERYDSGEPYCFQTAIAEHAVPAGFGIHGNLLFENREGAGAPGTGDLDEPSFQIGVRALVDRLRTWKALWGASFLVEYGS